MCLLYVMLCCCQLKRTAAVFGLLTLTRLHCLAGDFHWLLSLFVEQLCAFVIKSLAGLLQ